MSGVPAAGNWKDVLGDAGSPITPAAWSPRPMLLQRETGEEPSTAFEAEPSSATDFPDVPRLSRPASATGATSFGPTGDAMTTVEGSLCSWPFDTMSCATYRPSMSATKLGRTLAGSSSLAVLPVGVEISAHW